MTPAETALSLHPSREEFTEELGNHLLNGRVISTDRLFLMCRPVMKDWPEARLLDSTQYDPQGDCWYVWDAAGHMDELKSIPRAWLQERPFVAFHRGDRICVYPTSKIYR